MNVIGTCSRCGGAVATPHLWGGLVPPSPTCINCGAVVANYGRVIPMAEPPAPRPEPIRFADIDLADGILSPTYDACAQLVPGLSLGTFHAKA